MNMPAIRADGLWKEYAIGARARAQPTFRETLVDVFAAPVRRLRGAPAREQTETFYALRDVSFEIAPGEVVGIVGRNGAGKSTLLKILSRITAPTRGRVEIRGRIASLLEVGTGFHPELTGRENIRLNGAILGMSGAEIARKFDEIVAFSGVEKFIDTPVKHYSSGMNVRLAFAVAAHLEPEILLVDEVLAVGDAEFQKKCLGKMGEIASQRGRTVLFVSHQLGMVARLCARTLLLSQGEIAFAGDTASALDRYIASGAPTGANVFENAEERPHAPAAIVRVETRDADGAVVDQFPWASTVRVRVALRRNQILPNTVLAVGVENHLSVRVCSWYARLAEHLGAEDGLQCLEIAFPARVLVPGVYSFVVDVFEYGAIHHRVANVCPISIVDTSEELSAIGPVDFGTVIVPGEWTRHRIGASQPEAAPAS